MIASAQEKLPLARQAADLLYRHGARRVWVFGSVAAGRPQDFRSDIDLAVEGLPSQLYFQALGELLELFPCSVNLVEIEKSSPQLRQNIERWNIFISREN
ncbi:MAG: nucleotidyltransferase domain-containing protein [Verrucomicrobia bacterium]|nr:nucleotidyltransferase domain-containing protein [Verrucomicrobiota bacterium]